MEGITKEMFANDKVNHLVKSMTITSIFKSSVPLMDGSIKEQSHNIINELSLGDKLILKDKETGDLLYLKFKSALPIQYPFILNGETVLYKDFVISFDEYREDWTVYTKNDTSTLTEVAYDLCKKYQIAAVTKARYTISSQELEEILQKYKDDEEQRKAKLAEYITNEPEYLDIDSLSFRNRTVTPMDELISGFGFGGGRFF